MSLATHAYKLADLVGDLDAETRATVLAGALANLMNDSPGVALRVESAIKASRVLLDLQAIQAGESRAVTFKRSVRIYDPDDANDRYVVTGDLRKQGDEHDNHDYQARVAYKVTMLQARLRTQGDLERSEDVAAIEYDSEASQFFAYATTKTAADAVVAAANAVIEETQ